MSAPAASSGPSLLPSLGRAVDGYGWCYRYVCRAATCSHVESAVTVREVDCTPRELRCPTCAVPMKLSCADMVPDRDQPTLRHALCHRCGADVVRYYQVQGQDSAESAPAGAYGLRAVFATGYLSDKLPDGRIYDFRLCEDCCVWLLGELDTPAHEREY